MSAKSIALVGCGNWGGNILRDLLRLSCSVCVADIDPEARIRAANTGAWGTFPDKHDLPDCDGYVVAVPIPQLTRVCADLLKHKKPIFSEKTLCLSLDDFHLLQGRGGADYIFAMHKWHYHPGIEALRQIAESGRIGRIEELHTTRHAWVNDFHGGDVFWTQSVHDLTIIKHIFGHIPESIRAITIIKDDTGLPVSFTAVMGDKPAAVVSVSARHCSKVSGVSIHSREGSAELHDALDDHITIRDMKCGERVPIDTTFPLYLELREFVEYLGGGPKPRCGLSHAKEVTEAILRLREAARV